MDPAVASLSAAPGSVAVRAPQQQGVKYVCGGQSLAAPGCPCTMRLVAFGEEDHCASGVTATFADPVLPMCVWCRWAGRVRV
jgi:hypothetical protein